MLSQSFRDRIAKAALVLGVGGLAFAAVAAFVLPAAFGRRVTLIVTPNPPEIVSTNRSLWMAGDSVAAIYGTPVGGPMRVLFTQEARIIVPPEDPSLTLYTVDKNQGQNPLQERTVKFVAVIAAIGSGVFLLAGVLHFAWKRYRTRGSPSPL